MKDEYSKEDLDYFYQAKQDSARYWQRYSLLILLMGIFISTLAIAINTHSVQYETVHFLFIDLKLGDTTLVRFVISLFGPITLLILIFIDRGVNNSTNAKNFLNSRLKYPRARLDQEFDDWMVANGHRRIRIVDSLLLIIVGLVWLILPIVTYIYGVIR